MRLTNEEKYRVLVYVYNTSIDRGIKEACKMAANDILPGAVIPKIDRRKLSVNESIAANVIGGAWPPVTKNLDFLSTDIVMYYSEIRRWFRDYSTMVVELSYKTSLGGVVSELWYRLCDNGITVPGVQPIEEHHSTNHDLCFIGYTLVKLSVIMELILGSDKVNVIDASREERMIADLFIYHIEFGKWCRNSREEVV